MGPKKRLITAAAAAAGATTTERQQRSASNPVTTAKKRPTPGKAHSSPVARKAIAVASNATTVKRSTHGRTPSPAKKQQTVVSKEHEKIKEAEKDNKLEKTEIESKVSENLDTNQGEVVKDISNAEAAEESLAKDQLKTKLEQPEDSGRNVAHTIKSTKRTPSRENVKKSNTSETKEKSSCTTNKKVESEKQKADSEPPSTSATSANSNKSKVEDRKDGKNKAISKMLKSLDIQISGFDNILPSEERIQDTLKSSISENVKTKSRAAAVKVIASLNPPKSNIARIKARQEEDKKEKAKEKEKDKDKDKEKDKDKYKEKGKDKGKEKEKEKVEENHSKCKETEKIIEAAEVREEISNINTEESPITHDETLKSNKHTLDSVKEDTTKNSESQVAPSETDKKPTAKMAPKKKITAKRANKTDANQKSKKAPSQKPNDDESKAQQQSGNCRNDAIVGTPLKKRLLKAKLIKKSTEEVMEKNAGTSMPTEEKSEPQGCKVVEPPDPPDKESGEIKAEKTPKKTPSPKKVKTNPKNPDKCNIQEPEKTVVEPLDLIEKEETLRIVLDANTEVVQMDIEEMPVCASAPKEVEHKKEELDVKPQEADAEIVKQEPLKQEEISEKAGSSAPCSPLIGKKQMSNIKHRLQSKYKVPPVKSSPTAKMAGKKSKFAQKLAADKSNSSAANDIYDFRSGSEEEDNIKMDLPTLKNLREFADEEHKTKSTKESVKSKEHSMDIDEKQTKVEETLKEEQLPEPVLEEIKKSMENSETEEKAKEDADEKITDASHEAEDDSRAVVQTTPKTKKVVKSKVTKKVYKKKPLITKKVIKTVKGKMLQKTEKTKVKSSKVQKDSSSASSDSEDEKKLIDFGPKRHRMASLNALAKVQCLYENESRTAYELGLSKATQLPPKIRTVDGSEDEKDKEKDKDKEKETDEKSKSKKDKKSEETSKADEPQKAESEDEPQEVEPKRELRHVPGGRGLGKHWEFEESGDTEDEEIDKMKLKRKKLQKKLANKKEKEAEKLREKERKEEEASSSKISKAREDKDKEKENPKEKDTIRVKRKYTKIKKPLKKIVKLKTDTSDGGENTEVSDNEDKGQDKDKSKVQKAKLEARKPPKKRKRMLREELIGDYKGILARKRMASLNASAIVAATYEVERHLDKNLAYGSYDSTDGEEKTSTPAKKSKDVAKDSKKAPTATLTSDETLNTKDTGEVTANTTAAANSSNASNASGTARESRPLNLNEESNDSKYSKETKETNTDTTTTAGFRDSGSTKDAKDSSRPTSSSVVIVQDTDVTITGVYVNSTTGSSQEAYCKMQYRVQSSVTEERVLRPSSVDPPKSYTPLSALSSMLPPGASTGGAMSDAQVSPPPPPPPTAVGNTLPEALSGAGMYHASDLGLHPEHGAPEHGPPPPSYAAAAAAAAAAYHAHHMSPAAAAAAAAGMHVHHQHQYAHAHAHQYPQVGGEHGMHAGPPTTAGGPPPPPPHLYQPPPPSHYGPPPPPPPTSSVVGPVRCDVVSPPPTYRSSVYAPPTGPPHQQTAPSGLLPPPHSTLSMTAGSGASAFCAPNIHHHQAQHQHQHQQQQQQQSAGPQQDASGESPKQITLYLLFIYICMYIYS